LDGQVENGHFITGVCIFVKEKENLLSKDFSGNKIRWRTKRTVYLR